MWDALPSDSVRNAQLVVASGILAPVLCLASWSVVDVGSGLAILGSAEVSKDVIVRILGPTADYIGEGVRAWNARRVANVQHVLRKASDKLGDELENPGTVPPRVLKAVLEDAQFAEDELMVEYLGGVLASSRSEVGRDDRAAAAAATIGRLPAYAIRAHFIFYAAAHPHFSGVDFRSGGAARDAQVLISVEAFNEAMEFSDEERALLNDIFTDLMFALTREGLIQPQWAIGNADGLRGLALVDAQEDGIVYRLSNPGIVLFCAAHGIREDTLGRYPGPGPFPTLAGIRIPEVVLPRPLPPFPAPQGPPT